jgi:hypothetical protein
MQHTRSCEVIKVSRVLVTCGLKIVKQVDNPVLSINYLKHSGKYMHHLLYHSVTQHFVHRVFLWDSYKCQNNSDYFPKHYQLIN